MSRLALRSLRPFHRTLASVAPGPPPAQASTPFEVFDRNAKRRQRDRAATREGGEKSRVTDYLRAEVADRMAERFEDLRNPPGKILDLSSSSGHLSKLLTALESTKEIRMMDMSEKSLWRDPDSAFDLTPRRTVIDEEQLLSAVDEGSQDCIVSNMGLHWVNDLPGVLKQIQRALKPDGVFMGSMIGGDTLFELRTALQLAEQEREGGISPRISPMADPSDASNLMGRAGFALLTVDVEDVKINYPSIWELMEDLRDMGESNAVLGRRPFIKRDVLLAADAIYKGKFRSRFFLGVIADHLSAELHGMEDGTIPATFQVIFLIGWKPSPNQPKPLPRGSGQTNLKDVL